MSNMYGSNIPGQFGRQTFRMNFLLLEPLVLTDRKQPQPKSNQTPALSPQLPVLIPSLYKSYSKYLMVWSSHRFPFSISLSLVSFHIKVHNGRVALLFCIDQSESGWAVKAESSLAADRLEIEPI